MRLDQEGGSVVARRVGWLSAHASYGLSRRRCKPIHGETYIAVDAAELLRHLIRPLLTRSIRLSVRIRVSPHPSDRLVDISEGGG